MRIYSLVENTSTQGFPVEHGLSLYIRQNDGRDILFDMGQSSLFAENAQRLGLHIEDVHLAILSHGHYDHGGGLPTFFTLNGHAPVYIHRNAFQPHFSLHEDGLHYIGLDTSLQASPRLIFCQNKTSIDDNTLLFANVQGTCCSPTGNLRLFGPSENTLDNFCHEQNLLLQEGENLFLFAGCAHRGIVNILRHAQSIAGRPPTHVFAGMHLCKSGLSAEEELHFIHTLAQELLAYRHTQFYTMHCTGLEQYQLLHSLLQERIHYLACGDEIKITNYPK